MPDPPITPPPTIAELERLAAEIRCDLLTMIHAAGEGHPGGSLSAAEVVTALYFRAMRIDPLRPDWPDRDRFVLSKGHACPVWYATLIRRGYLDPSCLCTLRSFETQLQGHPDMRRTPGVEMTAGSLGHGLSAAIGMALAARLQRRDCRIWCMIGDGEMQEGAIWEAALAAPNWHLDNLTVILDQNGIQNDDHIANIMPIEPVADKWRAFNWRPVEIDGHDMGQVVEALEASRGVRGGPALIIAHTVKGKGVSFMEDSPTWHGRAPNDAELAQALAEICAAAGLEVQP